jgi:hypothetical protein
VLKEIASESGSPLSEDDEDMEFVMSEEEYRRSIRRHRKYRSGHAVSGRGGGVREGGKEEGEGEGRKYRSGHAVSGRGRGEG